MKSLEERFRSKVNKTSGCWLWTGARNSGGYGVIGRGHRSEGLIRASHVSWIIHNEWLPPGLWVLHRCDNPPCINPDHLFLGTPKDNMHDCLQKGRARRNPNYGEQHHSTKLTDAQIEEIRQAWLAAPPRRHGRVAFREQLMLRYGVTGTTIKAVVRGSARRQRTH